MVDGGGFATGTGPSGSGGISTHDPGFDQTNFLSWAEGVHFAMVTAFSTGEPQHVRPFVNDSLYERLAAEITATTPAQRTSVDTSDPHAVIVHAHTDASVDTIAVKMDGSLGLAEGGSGPSRWTFQRSSLAHTPVGGLSTTTTATCAGCGAPLKLDASGECVYCKTPFKLSQDSWALVEITAAQPEGAPFITVTTPWGSTTVETAVETTGAKAARGLVGVIIIGSIILGVVGAIIGIVVAISGAKTANNANAQAQSATAQAESAASAAASSAEQQASSALSALTTLPAAATPAAPATTPAAAPLSVDAHLTLSGSINLSPSDLDQGEFTLNTHTDGTCPAANEPLHTITLDVTFDSGASLQGSFALSTPIGRSASADFANGGAALLHFIGPTQAAADDEKWPMPAGQPGLVTVTTDATGGGTLKWQGLQPSEPSSNYAGPLSGLVTWTCS
jgi:predicted lipid-binding transport protein (Tim44 family)